MPEITELLAVMKDGEPKLRNRARDILIEQEDAPLMDALAEALRDGTDAGRRNAAMDVYVALGARSVPELDRLSRDEDPEIRNFACVMMGSIEDPRSVSALLNALSDPEAIVSHAAAEALGKVGDPSAVPFLVEVLDTSDSWWSVFPVIAALGEIRDERAVMPLIRHIGNEFYTLNILAALEIIASPTALETLFPMLVAEDEPVRHAALRTVVAIKERAWGARVDDELCEGDDGFLSAFRSFAAREELVRLLDSSETGLRRAALITLGGLRETRAVGGMLRLLQDEELSEVALSALVNIGLPALTEIEKNLEHPVGLVRQALVKYLATISPPFSGPPLLRMLNDEMSIVRAQAALAIGGLCLPEAVDPLISALADENPEVQEAAITALAGLDPKMVCERLLPHLGANDRNKVYIAAEALGQLGLDEAVNPLAALLDSDDEVVREVSVKSIGLIGGRYCVMPLFRALGDPAIRVRQQAIISLGKLRMPGVLEKLIELCGDRDEAVSYYAVRSLKEQGSLMATDTLVGIMDRASKNLKVAIAETLGSIGDRSACTALTEAALAGDRDVSLAAAQAIGELRCPGSAPALISLLSDGHWSVVGAAAEALGKVGGDGAFEALAGLLTSRDRVILEKAVTALGDLGDPAAVPLVIPLILDDTLGYYANYALRMIGEPAAVGLIEASGNVSFPAHLAIIRLLGEVGGSLAAGWLAGRLGHGEPSVRKASASALGNVGDSGMLPELERLAGSDDEPMVRHAAASAIKKIQTKARS